MFHEEISISNISKTDSGKGQAKVFWKTIKKIALRDSPITEALRRVWIQKKLI